MNALQYLCISKCTHCLSFSQEPSVILYNYTGNVHDYAIRFNASAQPYSSLRLNIKILMSVSHRLQYPWSQRKLLHIFSLFFCILRYCSYICCRQIRLKVTDSAFYAKINLHVSFLLVIFALTNKTNISYDYKNITYG